MSIQLYDDALLDKLKNWTKDTHITITSPGETRRLFEVIANENRDRPIKLPLIALSRTAGFRVLNTNNQSLSYNAELMEANINRGMRLNAIPIEIDYQISVYTRYLEEADELMRNLIFNIINYPKVQIAIPYHDANILHDSNIRMSTDIQDDSSTSERLFPGQFTKLTLDINIDDAYLFDVRIKDNV